MNTRARSQKEEEREERRKRRKRKERKRREREGRKEEGISRPGAKLFVLLKVARRRRRWHTKPELAYGVKEHFTSATDAAEADPKARRATTTKTNCR